MYNACDMHVTNVCNGPEAVWNELDIMLSNWVRVTEAGSVMEERSGILSGPEVKDRELLVPAVSARDSLQRFLR